MSDSISDTSYQTDDLVIETCLEIHDYEVNSPTPRGFNGLLIKAPGNSTSVANVLSQQLIHQLNLVLPNALENCDDLNVKPGDAAFALLQPPAKQALERAIQARGIPMVINSAYRTIAQQMLLFNWLNRTSPVARPGRSNHQSGLALDIEDPRGWEPFLIRHNWQPLAGDPPHFDYVGGSTTDIRSTAILAFQKLWNKNHPNEKIKEDGKWGLQTENALNNSPTTGFDIAPWDEIPRILRLSKPLMQGSDVIELQEKLKAAGLAVSIDGVFGSGTEKAVKEFQQQKSLVADGIVGEKTRQLIA
ncbi:peptidoglycan-binding protein [Nostoc sp. CCY 9925]|uniref:peptidoglycan-binding protein n=1 Tax=Nostoc sp. CCY 9925 TaxID=3103865 RepID=UPI0039C71B03